MRIFWRRVLVWCRNLRRKDSLRKSFRYAKVHLDSRQYTRAELNDVLDRLYKCRDLEISNLWQRSVFLSVFMILCFTGYGYLFLQIIESWTACCISSSKIDYLNISAIALGCISIIFSSLFTFMAKGSKAWYEVYETAITSFQWEHRDVLRIPRYNIMGEMGLHYKKMSSCLYSPKAGPFSPSKINVAIGQICSTIWVLVVILHSILLVKPSIPIYYLLIAILILTLTATMVLMFSNWVKSGHLSKYIYDKHGMCKGAFKKKHKKMKTNKGSKRCVKCKDWLRSIPYRGFDIIIIAILILSVYVILVIGLDLDCLKAGLNSTPKMINNINSVLLNLSYSYAAGVFVYILTAMRPYYKRRRKFADYIYSRTLEYKEHASISSLYTFFEFDFFKENDANMAFFESQDNLTKLFVERICPNETFETLDERSRYTFNQQNILADFILTNSDFLPDEILHYGLPLNTADSEARLDVCLSVINEFAQNKSDAVSAYRDLYNLFVKYINDLNKLEHLIEKYTSKRIKRRSQEEPVAPEEPTAPEQPAE